MILAEGRSPARPLATPEPRATAGAIGRASDVVFATLSDPRSIDALGAEWSSLFDACSRPHQAFQSFEWLAIWRALYAGRTMRPAVVTGRIEGRLTLVWPLAVERRFGLRILSVMGHPLSQYGDALIGADLDSADEDAAIDHIVTLPVDVLSLRRVRDDAAIAPALQRRFGVPAVHDAAPFIDLAGVKSVEAFEQRFCGKVRASRRRRRRRLEELGALRFDHVTPSLDAAALVATAIAFKRDWARHHGILAPSLADPRFERFFLEAATSGQSASSLRVSALRCGTTVVGVEISVLCQGHLFGHVLAPHPDYAKYGVGGILAEATILNAIAQGYAGVDLLPPADAYKLEWTGTSVGVGDYVLPLSAAGRLYDRLWLRRGRAAFKRLAHRARPLVARFSRPAPHAPN